MKIFEKYILALVCLLYANVWAAWNNDQTTPSQDENDVYLISTPAELAGFANIVNTGKYDAKARLTEDLIFGDDEKTNMCTSENVSSCWKSWNPIGPDASKAFTGVLDGDGHTIYGLFVSSTEMALGLVGVLGEGGVVKNLNVVNPRYVSKRNWLEANYFSLGGVVGTNYGIVLNCHVIDASVDVSNADVAYHSATGGVVGINGDANHQNAKVLNCSSSGTIVGRYVGGVVGWNNYGLVSCSYSTANIVGKTEGKDNADPTLDSTYAGGIIGYNATNATLDLSVYYGGDISLTDAGWSGSLIGNGGDGSAVRESYYEDTDGPGAGECGSGSSGCSFDGVDIDTLTEPQKEALVDTLNKNAKENCEANGGSNCDVPAWNLKDGEIISTGAENAKNAADGHVTLQMDNDATKASVVISGKKDGDSVTGGTAFDKNTEISITLTLLNGAEFQKWTNSSGDSIGNSNPYTFTISSSTYLKTNFAEPPETETIVAQYGENATDTIEVVVPVSADSAARVDAVNDAFENHDPAIESPQKTDGSADSTYTFTGFEPDENGVYQPTFEAEVKTETIVAQYGENATDTIEVVVPVSADSAARVTAVNEAFENHNPAIPDPQKTDGSADSTYTFTGFEPDENGVYQPTFEAEVKTETIVAQYGENATDTIEVVVPVSADSAARVAAVNDAFENHDPAIESPQKTDGSADSTYTFTGFEPDENGVYQPTFEAEVKTETVVAQYGENATDTILVVVPVETDSVNRVTAVNDAFTNHNPPIDTPQKVNGSDDFTYTFTGFVPDEDGVYKPVFDAEVKKETMVIAYGDGVDERINVVVPVTYGDNERIDAIDSALKAHTPPIEVKKTNGSDDSTYTHIGWQTKIDKDSNVVVDENGNPVYEPMFEATVKTTELVVVYGADPEKDVVRIPVPVTLRDSAARVQLVIDSLAAWKITPTKTDEDSTYTFDKWNVDGDTYTAEFISSPKYIEVVVGDDTVKVKVPVDDEGGQGGSQGDDVAVEIKVVVDEDTLTVSVSDGDVLDSVIKEVVKDDPTKTGEDSTYEFSGWEPITDDTGKPVVDENGNPIYGPAFEAEVKTETMVIAYGDGVDERINVVVPVTYGDNERIDAIDSALKAHTPPIEVKKTNGSEDSSYTHIGWRTKTDNEGYVVVDENGNPVYEPMFEATVKTTELVVVYGADPEKDVVRIPVPVTLRDSAARVQLVIDSLAAWKITPTKTDEDSTYTFDKWNVDGDTYTAEFKSTVKTMELVVVYGSDPAKDSIHVVVHVPDNDSIRLEKVKAAIETAGIIPMKAEDADSIYSFNGNWAKTEDGFCAEFDGKAKFIKVVVGDDTVKVVIPEDPSSDSGDGDEVVVEIKVVVDDDTIKVPVSEGDILDSAANKALDSIPTKDDTADSTYEFAGWKPITDDSGEPIVDENGNPVYEPVFEADVKKETIIASTGDDKGGSIKVIIKVTDTDAEIQDAIKKAFEDNDISLPSKERENEKVYTFEKFVYNRDSGIFEPKFEQHIMFDIAFVLPEKGKLVENIEGYVYGEKTVLPDAIIMDEDGWEFKGWFTKRDGLGTRVKMMLETDVGNKTFYPLFQKTISYNSNGKKGTIEVIYSENAEKNILRALDRVIPEDYSKKNVNYTFDKWVLENGTYVAKFVEGQGIHSNVQMNFYVNVFGHTLEISGVNSGSEICVFDVRGRLVQSAVVSIGSLRMILPNSGRYFVRVSDRIVPVIVR